MSFPDAEVIGDIQARLYEPPLEKSEDDPCGDCGHPWRNHLERETPVCQYPGCACNDFKETK